MEHLTLNIAFTFFFQFPADMSGYGIDICLQHLYILENGMIDALQYVIGRIGFECGYFIRVIDKPGS